MFHRSPHAGSASFWEETWSDGQLDEALRFCEVDPLRPLFERYARDGTRLLEGGCGRGQYVLYYGARGVWVAGLDFATQAIGRLKVRSPKARLCAGNVSALPFKECTFDVYYSGGVVEHFEGGALPALREARRVLRPEGVLLVSVPYLSPLRRLSPLWRRDRRFVQQQQTETDNDGWTFWQYAFAVSEFRLLLVQAGFRVVQTLPYSILFGLYDLPLVPRLLERRGRPTLGPAAETPPRSRAAPEARRTLAKRLLVSEDRTIPGVGVLVEVAGRLCANMMMYVCTRADDR